MFDLSLTSELLKKIDISTGLVDGADVKECYLDDMRRYYADPLASDPALGRDNPLIYRVSYDRGNGESDIEYGVGTIMPGTVGREFFMTKGHFHQLREAAEIYIGLSGKGLLLMEDERTGLCRAVPFETNTMVIVPGFNAHRTVNIGNEPLIYIGIYSAQAGHDYGRIAERNFRYLVLADNGKYRLVNRDEYIRKYQTAVSGNQKESPV